MEVIEWLGIRLLDADVLEAVPLEENLARLDVDLLSDPVEHDTVYRTPHAGQVPLHLVVDGDQRRVLWGDEKLVVLALKAVGRPEPPYLLVGAVAPV